MGGLSWFLLVAVATGLLWVMRYANAKLDAILVRASACTFMGAGMISGAGWLGHMIGSVMGWVQTVGSSAGTTLVGTSMTWIIATGLGVMWVLSMLPSKWFAWDPADWLVVSGLFLPSLLSSVPGELGNGLRAVMELGGHSMTEVVAWAVS